MASRDVRKKLRRNVRSAALVVSLALSAFITGAALRSPDQDWPAWFSFLPLFVVVRLLRPMMAALAGGLWGACLYLFTAAGAGPAVQSWASAIGPSAGLLALLTVIPAVYVGLAARRRRAIGFKLLTLALGWTLIEVVLVATYTNTPEPRVEWNPDLSGARAVLQDHGYSSGLQKGLLTGSQGEGLHSNWLARLLGYICTVFLVGCANASPIRIVSGARLSFPPYRSLPGAPNVVGWLSSQVVMTIQSWTLRQAHPRAPPIQVAPAR